MRTSKFAVLMMAMAGCGGGDPVIDRIESGRVTVGELTVTGAFALPPFTDAPLPVYLTLENTGAVADTLRGATSPAADSVMLHGGGMAMMSALEVPAGGSLIMAPGGLHLMLQPPVPRLVRGDSVQVTLDMARSGEVTVWAMVIDYAEADVVR